MTKAIAHTRWYAGATMFAAAPAALAHAGADGSWGHPGMSWGGGMGWIMGPVIMIVLLIAAVAAAVVLVRWLGGAGDASPRPGASGERTAIRILEERFARGEIDDEEFRRRREALGD